MRFTVPVAVADSAGTSMEVEGKTAIVEGIGGSKLVINLYAGAAVGADGTFTAYGMVRQI